MPTPRKQVRPNKVIETGALTAVRSIFESAGHIYQSVDGSNDIGKDAYVDIVEGTDVTGDLIALQIKGGSYKRSSGWAIPCTPADRELWRTSSVPVFGFVYDPDSNRV